MQMRRDIHVYVQHEEDYFVCVLINFCEIRIVRVYVCVCVCVLIHFVKCGLYVCVCVCVLIHFCEIRIYSP